VTEVKDVNLLYNTPPVANRWDARPSAAALKRR
jgi:hypothetical protein